MTKPVQSLEPLVSIKRNQAVTSSRDVAKYFEKSHKNVLQAIDRLECSKEFNRLNFKPVEYKDAKGEMRRAYWITRSGFSMLAMGFTGKKATAFKAALERFLTFDVTTRPVAIGA